MFDIEDSISRYMAGELNENEAAELLRAIEENPRIVETICNNLRVDFLMPRLVRYSRSGEIALTNDNLAEIDFDALVHMEKTSEQLPPLRKDLSRTNQSRAKSKADASRKSSDRRTTGIPKILSAVVACLLLVAVALFYFEPKKDSTQTMFRSLAKVVSVADPIFPDDAPIFHRDQQIDEETIRLSSGFLKLQLKNGVLVVLEGPVSFSLQSAEQTFCKQGRLSVHVPKGAEGFEVRTPQMNIRDLGTEFVIDISETESTVHVITGKVEIDRFGRDRSTLTQGIGMTGRQNGDFRQIEADKKLYIDSQLMDRFAREYDTKRTNALSERRIRLEKDPDLMFYFELSADESLATLRQRTGIVRATKIKKSTGSGQGRASLSFDNISDELAISVPRQTDTFTLVASIRLDKLVQGSHTIFSIGDQGPGSLHWQINMSGQLQLMLGDRKISGAADYSSDSTYRTEKVVSPGESGVWLQAAVVVHAEEKRIRHYLDGKLCADIEWKHPIKFDFTAAEIGNWQHRDRTPAPRQLNGRIDNLIILNRACSTVEIQTLTTPL